MEQDPMIRRLREQISDNDVALVAGMNRRLELVTELWRYKQARGLEVLDAEREDWIPRYLARANRGPISHSGLIELVEEILELTKRELAELIASTHTSR